MDINGWSELKKWLIKHKALGENIDNPLYITRLNLSSKEIKELPGSIELLENLVTLDLSDNFLEALPESIKNLKKLINLNISKNNFKVLPEVLGEKCKRQFDRKCRCAAKMSEFKQFKGS
ncbi:hypothetical protein [Lebetimonas sp. JH292]|uniref:hypothetical protein n=1 Tax=Lebetimonas sp. JH292 TaxID=990068 RepID=UPI0004652A3A|nr:hypothetical protein [Lebetimonas sp. JH292]